MEQKNLGKPFSNTEISAFCGQMALVLKSGISTIEGVSIMLEDSRSKEEQAVLQAIQDEIIMTGSLYMALESTGLFPPYMLNMIQIGEETGTLDEVMDALETHYSREESIRKSIKSSLTFPMIMIGMMIVVIVVLLVKVLPVFNQVFVQLGTEMTGFSSGLLKVGNAMSTYSAVFIGILAVVVVLVFIGLKTAGGRKSLVNVAYKFGFTRTIFESMAACRFASGMALTLKAGLNPDRSLELVTALNDDDKFKEKLDKATNAIYEGNEMTKSLYEAGVFTGVYARMASIGEKTGSLDQVMDQIADLYQDDIDTRITNVLSVLEPVLVVVLSLIVGIILVSVMLPLLGIMSSM